MAKVEGVFVPLKPQINAMEIFLTLYALWVGVSVVLIPRVPNSVELLLGTGWAIFWATGLIGGALIALIGNFWRGRGIVAMSFQQLGYTMFGFASIARGLAVLILARQDISSAVIITAFGVAALIRVVQLENRIRTHRDIPTWAKRWWSRNG